MEFRHKWLIWSDKAQYKLKAAICKSGSVEAGVPAWHKAKMTGGLKNDNIYVVQKYMGKPRPIIHLATDHAGFELKEAVAIYLRRAGYDVRDHGAFSAEPSDYPEFIIPAAEAVARSRRPARGIVFGGSGIGECLAANKVRGIRAALVYDRYSAVMSREHNDANIMSLGSRTPSGVPRRAKELIGLWLKTGFSGDARHGRRLRQINAYEKRPQNKK